MKLEIRATDNGDWLAVNELSGELLGKLTTWENYFHPNNLYISFENSLIPNQKVYIELLEAVYNQKQRSLQTSIMSNNDELSSLLLSSNFERKRRCWEFSIEASEFLESNQNNLEIQIHRFKDADAGLFLALKKLIVAIYQETHEIVNPLSSQLTVEECFQIMCEKLSLTHSYYYKIDEQLYFCCIEEVEGQAFISYLGYRGDETLYRAFLIAVFNRLFQTFEVLDFEVDDINEYAMIMEEFYHFRELPSYDAYVLNKA